MASPAKVRYELFLQSSSSSSTIDVLAYLIERTIARNNKIAKSTNPRTQNPEFGVFESVAIPQMGIQAFLETISRNTQISPSVLVVAYAYIDRICQFNPQLMVLQSNVHRILITSVMVAAKFLEDLNYRNSHYARVAGLSLKEMNKLELSFLCLIQFKLRITVNVFESYCSHLEREVGIGGGYQIERTLRFVCRGERDKSKQQKQSTTVVHCSSN